MIYLFPNGPCFRNYRIEHGSLPPPSFYLYEYTTLFFQRGSADSCLRITAGRRAALLFTQMCVCEHGHGWKKGPEHLNLNLKPVLPRRQPLSSLKDAPWATQDGLPRQGTTALCMLVPTSSVMELETQPVKRERNSLVKGTFTSDRCRPTCNSARLRCFHRCHQRMRRHKWRAAVLQILCRCLVVVALTSHLRECEAREPLPQLLPEVAR